MELSEIGLDTRRVDQIRKGGDPLALISKVEELMAESGSSDR
jgi:hypothetical protein